MEDTLHALAGILVRAIPTVAILLLLHFYLKAVFFKPLDKVLKSRYELTEGSRQKAEESLRNAESLAAEYAAQLRQARAEIYASQEKLHKELEDRHAAEVAEARAQADALIKTAKAQIAGDVEAAKQSLGQESDRLAERIAETLLGRRV